MLAQLLHKLNLLLPAQCPRCRFWRRKGGMRPVQLCTGAWITICARCYYQLYPGRKSLR